MKLLRFAINFLVVGTPVIWVVFLVNALHPNGRTFRGYWDELSDAFFWEWE